MLKERALQVGGFLLLLCLQPTSSHSSRRKTKRAPAWRACLLRGLITAGGGRRRNASIGASALCDGARNALQLGAWSWQVQEGRDPEGAGALPWGTCRFMPPPLGHQHLRAVAPCATLVSLGYGEGDGTGRGVAEVVSRPPSCASFGVGKWTFQRCYPLLR